MTLPERNIELQAPRNVIAGFFETDDGSRVIHILDYEMERSLTDVEVRFECPQNLGNTAVFKTIEDESKLRFIGTANIAPAAFRHFKRMDLSSFLAYKPKSNENSLSFLAQS